MQILNPEDEVKRVAILEDETVFRKTISFVDRIITPANVRDITTIVDPTRGFTTKGAILYATRTKDCLLAKGILTPWGYWKPFGRRNFVNHKIENNLGLKEIDYCYFVSQELFPSGSLVPFPDLVSKRNYQKMIDSFKY
ncbi:MAG: hypothetical protein ACOX6Q_03810 [Candidatus Dojkabacteria bacterium]